LCVDGPRPVSLMRGAPDLPTPEHIIDAANRALANGRTGYPDNRGEPVLRDAVAQAIRDRGGPAYDPVSEILITTGATLGIHSALGAILNPGDEVLLPEPVYDAYTSVITVQGGRAVPVPAAIDNGRFTWPAERVAAAITPRTRALLVNSPWNPTGTVLSEGEWRSLMQVAAAHDLWVVSDEIYDSICCDGHSHQSPASLSDDARSRTIVVNSLSKTYAMTGWRVGYCAAPPDVIHGMYLILQQSSRGPATFVQDAAVAALTGSQDCVAEMNDEYARRRQQVIEAFDDVDSASVMPPEGGFFAMLDVTALGRESNDVRRELLINHSVVVMHGGAYGPSGEGTLRLSFASGGENLAEGLARVTSGLRQLGS